jgi:hypothetical protein
MIALNTAGDENMLRVSASRGFLWDDRAQKALGKR